MKSIKWLWMSLLVVVLGCTLSAPTEENIPTKAPASFSPVMTPSAISPVATPTIVSPLPSPTPVVLATPVASRDHALYLPLIFAPEATPTPVPTATPPPTSTPLPPPVPKPSFGIQIDPNTDDPALVLRWVEGLGFGWIKIQAEWGSSNRSLSVIAGWNWTGWCS